MFLDSKLITEGLNLLNNKTYVVLPVLIYYLIAAYTDFKTYKIPNKLNLSLFLLRVILIPKLKINDINFYGMLVGFLIAFIPAFILYKPMGGDIKMLTVIGFYLGPIILFFNLVIAVLLSFIFAAIWRLIRKEKRKRFPFAVFMLLGFILLNIFYIFI